MLFPQWLSFAKYFSRLSFHLLDGFLAVHIIAYYSPLKEINPAVSDNMDDPKDAVLSEVSWTEADGAGSTDMRHQQESRHSSRSRNGGARS